MFQSQSLTQKRKKEGSISMWNFILHISCIISVKRSNGFNVKIVWSGENYPRILFFPQSGHVLRTGGILKGRTVKHDGFLSSLFFSRIIFHLCESLSSGLPVQHLKNWHQKSSKICCTLLIQVSTVLEEELDRNLLPLHVVVLVLIWTLQSRFVIWFYGYCLSSCFWKNEGS